MAPAEHRGSAGFGERAAKHKPFFEGHLRRCPVGATSRCFNKSLLDTIRAQPGSCPPRWYWNAPATSASRSVDHTVIQTADPAPTLPSHRRKSLRPLKHWPRGERIVGLRPPGGTGSRTGHRPPLPKALTWLPPGDRHAVLTNDRTVPAFHLTRFNTASDPDGGRQDECLAVPGQGHQHPPCSWPPTIMPRCMDKVLAIPFQLATVVKPDRPAGSAAAGSSSMAWAAERAAAPYHFGVFLLSPPVD